MHNRSRGIKSYSPLLLNVSPCRNKMAFWRKICCFWVQEFFRTHTFHVEFGRNPAFSPYRWWEKGRAYFSFLKKAGCFLTSKWLVTEKFFFIGFLKMSNFLQFGFMHTLLFHRKASNFTFFLPLVVEKWNFFTDNIFKYVFFLFFYVIGYVNIQSFRQNFSKVWTLVWLSYFFHGWFFNYMIFSPLNMQIFHWNH